MSNRITRVSVHGEGLKRQTFELALQGCDLLVGPNGAGKTTRGPLGITAAIEGLATVPTDARRPYVGELPESIVSLEIYTPDGPRKLTRDLSVSRGRVFTDTNSDAQRLVGVPPTAWDLRDFAAGTDGDRGKILDAVARAGGSIKRWSAQEAQQHLAQVHGEARGGGDEEDVFGDDVFGDDWAAPYNDCVSALETAPDGATWLKAALVWAEDAQRKTNAAQKQAAATMESALENVPRGPDGDVPALEARKRELHKREARLDRAAGDVAQIKGMIQRHEDQGDRLRRNLQAIEERGARLKQPLEEPDTSIPEEVTRRVYLAILERDKPIGEHDGPDLDELRAELNAADEELTAAQARLDEAKQIPDAGLQAAQRKVVSARSSVLELESVSGNGHAVCVHCGGGDPLGIAAHLQEAKAELAALDEKLEEAAEAHLHRSAMIETAEAAFAKADLRARRARAALDAATAAQAGHPGAVKASRQRELEAAEAELAREKGRAQERQEAYDRALAERDSAIAQARDDWRAAKAALHEWAASEPPELPAPPSQEELEQLKAELHEVEAALKAHHRHQAAVDAAKRAGEHFQAARLRWEATRALVAAIRQTRDDMAAAAYGPIDRAARELLSAPELPTPYFAGPDDFGAEVPGRGRVPYAGLSESEQRITASALVYALATVAGCPCRLVMIDGLEVVQRDHRAPLIAALAQARLEGKADSVVLTMATAPGEDLEELRQVEGLTLHEIERTASTPARPANRPTTTPEPAPAREATPQHRQEPVQAPGDPCPF